MAQFKATVEVNVSTGATERGANGLETQAFGKRVIEVTIPANNAVEALSLLEGQYGYRSVRIGPTETGNTSSGW